MNKTYTTTAIILNRKDIKETDRLLVFYTQDYGKIEAIAVGARKATSKMAKFLEPLMEVELLLACGKNYDRVAEVKLLDNFTNLKQDYAKWLLGCYCLELVNKLTKVELNQPEIFFLLKEVLSLLQSESNKNLLLFYVWKLLSLLGYQPQLQHCAACGADLTNDADFYFHLHHNEVKCQRCAITAEGVIKCETVSLNILANIGQNRLIDIEKINMSSNSSQPFTQLISSLLRYHLDCELQTAKFFKS